MVLRSCDSGSVPPRTWALVSVDKQVAVPGGGLALVQNPRKGTGYKGLFTGTGAVSQGSLTAIEATVYNLCLEATGSVVWEPASDRG